MEKIISVLYVICLNLLFNQNWYCSGLSWILKFLYSVNVISLAVLSAACVALSVGNVYTCALMCDLFDFFGLTFMLQICCTYVSLRVY